MLHRISRIKKGQKMAHLCKRVPFKLWHWPGLHPQLACFRKICLPEMLSF